MQARTNVCSVTIKPDPGVVAEQLMQIVSPGMTAPSDSGSAMARTQLFTLMENGGFEIDGLRISYSRQKAASGIHVAFQAQVGILPFTAEGPGKREALKAILEAAQTLHHARFYLDEHSVIHLSGAADFDQEPDDADIMLALLAMQREAAPFLQLIAAHL